MHKLLEVGDCDASEKLLRGDVIIQVDGVSTNARLDEALSAEQNEFVFTIFRECGFAAPQPDDDDRAWRWQVQRRTKSCVERPRERSIAPLRAPRRAASVLAPPPPAPPENGFPAPRQIISGSLADLIPPHFMVRGDSTVLDRSSGNVLDHVPLDVAPLSAYVDSDGDVYFFDPMTKHRGWVASNEDGEWKIVDNQKFVRGMRASAAAQRRSSLMHAVRAFSSIAELLPAYC